MIQDNTRWEIIEEDDTRWKTIEEEIPDPCKHPRILVYKTGKIHGVNEIHPNKSFVDVACIWFFDKYVREQDGDIVHNFDYWRYEDYIVRHVPPQIRQGAIQRPRGKIKAPDSYFENMMKYVESKKRILKVK